jgi:hypothetical protein
VSKKRPSARRRAASATRRKTTSRSSKRRTKSRRRTAPRERTIQLKPIAALLGTTLERLKRIPQTPATKRTIERLEHCSAEFAAICNPMDPDGCGMSMEFPDPVNA